LHLSQRYGSNKGLWDRLKNEPGRACRAFESYRNLPSGKRTLIEAYRQLRLESAHSTVEAAAVEARRRVRLNEER
jgi:hypothetical protein